MRMLSKLPKVVIGILVLACLYQNTAQASPKPILPLKREREVNISCAGSVIPRTRSVITKLIPRADTEVTVDIGVFYTTQALKSVGGLKAAKVEALSLVDQTNSIYLGSGLNLKIALVHLDTIDLPENSDLQIPLAEIQNGSDGIADQINSERLTRGFDVAVLVQNAYNSIACGLAYQYADPQSSFSDYAFTVIARDCFPSYVLAHELGHIMGANHNEGRVQIDGAYNFSRGFVFTTAQGINLQTIMGTEAYSRVPFFSSPNLKFENIAIGSEQANNALAISNIVHNVANYQSRASLPISLKSSKVGFSQVLSAKKEGSTCKIVGQVLDKKVHGIKGVAISVNKREDLLPISPIRFANVDGKASFNVTAPSSGQLYLYYPQSNQRSRYFACK